MRPTPLSPPGLAFLLATTLIVVGCAHAMPTPRDDVWPTEAWPTSTPEEQGVSSAALAEGIEAALAEGLPLHSLLVIRHGRVVLDTTFHPFAPGLVHDIASCTKSITATLVGIALDRGDIPTLDRTALSYFPDRPSPADASKKGAITLSHLLTMTSGLDCRAGPAGDLPLVLGMMATTDWAGYVLDRPMAAKPGREFTYCGPGSHLLSVILRKATGRPVRDYAQEHLFGPLGITSAQWLTDPATGDVRGWGDLAMTPGDLARIGTLYLHGGLWNGRRVLSGTFVEAATRRHMPVRGMGPLDGYGYQWWTSSGGFFVALGRGGQVLLVAPRLDLVVVITGEEEGAVMARKAAWLQRHVLAAVRAAGPLPPDPAGTERLAASARRAREGAPEVAVPVQPPPTTAQRVSGSTFALDPNPLGLRDLSLAFTEGQPEATVQLGRDGQPPWRVTLGLDGAWRSFPGNRGLPARGRGTWTTPDTLVADIDEVANIGRWRVAMTFEENRVTVRIDDASGIPSVVVEGHRVAP